MKHRIAHSPILRFLLILCSVVLTCCAFMWVDLPKQQQTQPGKLEGTASDGVAESYVPNLPEIRQLTMCTRIECEENAGSNGTRIATDRIGYSGEGYLTDIPEQTESAVSVTVDVPASQLYAITVCAGTENQARHQLRVNGRIVAPFAIDGKNDFTCVMFSGIFLEEGEAEIALDTVEGTLDADYIELSNDTSLNAISFDIADVPCDPEASPAAQKLYHFLYENWGKSILTGQYVSGTDNRELQLIHDLTGQLPAIRFSEMGKSNDRQIAAAAFEWAYQQKGLVGLMWQWNAPDSDSVYAKDTAFNLYNALRKTDPEKLAMLTPDEAEAAAARGTITEDAVMLLRDIDQISERLTVFSKTDIPVLWRPLHEASGGWYWWGAYGTDAYRKLWSLVYHRMTKYHELHNLIWIWNGQSAGYLVPADTYDIASADIYLSPDANFGSRYEQYQSLGRVTQGKKLLAMSECSAPPKLEQMLIDHSYWTFYGQWYGEYLMTQDGNFADTYYSSSDLCNLYNSKEALSLNDFLAIYQ